MKTALNGFNITGFQDEFQDANQVVSYETTSKYEGNNRTNVITSIEISVNKENIKNLKRKKQDANKRSRY